MNKVEQLRKCLEKARAELNARGLKYIPGESKLMDCKPFEIAYQDCIENIWPDEPWWKITNYWDIFDAMMGGLSDEEVIEEIINHISPEFAEEKKPNVEEGHTWEEYKKEFGDMYFDGDLWDFSEEDLLGGAVEINPDIVYWKIEVDGEPRYFETTKEIKEELHKLDEGTSNFPTRFPHGFPLLVFYTIDEIYSQMDYTEGRPEEADFEDEDGNVDEDAYWEARDAWEQKFWDDVDCCVLDEDAVERLEDALYEFNKETENIAYEADVVDGEQQYGDKLNLEDVKLKIEPGYYEAAYIDVDGEESLDYIEDGEWADAQIKRIMDFMLGLKKEFGLSQYKVAWGPASNGETGYSKVKDEEESEVKENMYDGKKGGNKGSVKTKVHVNKNAGNPKRNMEIFNHMMGSDAPAVSTGVALGEGKDDIGNYTLFIYAETESKDEDVLDNMSSISDELTSKYLDSEDWATDELDLKGCKKLIKELAPKIKEKIKAEDKKLKDSQVSNVDLYIEEIGDLGGHQIDSINIWKAGKNESIKESEEVSREEYCLMADGDNIDCYANEEEAIKSAEEYYNELKNRNLKKNVRVLKVTYGPENEVGDSEEEGIENVWDSGDIDGHYFESLKEEIKVGDQGFIKKGSPFGKKGYTVTKVDGNSIEILSWDSKDRRTVDASEFEVKNESLKESYPMTTFKRAFNDWYSDGPDKDMADRYKEKHPKAEFVDWLISTFSPSNKDRKYWKRQESKLLKQLHDRKISKFPDEEIYSESLEEDLLEGLSANDFYNQLIGVIEEYIENLENEDGDTFAGTEDSYANEMLSQHVWDLVDQLDTTDEKKDTIFSKIINNAVKDPKGFSGYLTIRFGSKKESLEETTHRKNGVYKIVFPEASSDGLDLAYVYHGWEECEDVIKELKKDKNGRPFKVMQKCKDGWCEVENESLKEDIDEYDPDFDACCEDVANGLESGWWHGMTRSERSWGLEVNGGDGNQFSPAFADVISYEVSYPVRDGYFNYSGLDCNITKSSFDVVDFSDESDREMIKTDLLAVGCSEEDINAWLDSEDGEIEFFINYNIDIDDLEEDEEDEVEYDRRAVEKEYDLEDGELDGVSIRDAEEMVGEEEGALDRFILESLKEGKEDLGLPSEVDLQIDDELRELIESNDEDEFVEYVSNWLSDEYGFCHFGWNYDIDTKKDCVHIYNIEWDTSESLKEDTVKQNGKWVNKGKEGTHGEFKTKKAADAQRKAMFANGYKEELEPEYLSDKVTKVLDDYGILYGDIVENGDGTVNIVGVDESEWDEVVEAIRDELGLDVLVPDYDHEEFDDELIVSEGLKEIYNARGMAYYEYPKGSGCHVREVPSCFVAVSETGRSLGESQTAKGAEAIIDEYLGEKEQTPIKESFEEIYIKYWEDEECRDQGISEIYRDNFATREEAIEVARKLIDRDGFASVEVFVSPSGILESEDDILVWGYDGVETWGLGKEEGLEEASSAEKKAFKDGGQAYKDYVDGKAIARIKDPEMRKAAVTLKKSGADKKALDRFVGDRKVNQADDAFQKKQVKMSDAGLTEGVELKGKILEVIKKYLKKKGYEDEDIEWFVVDEEPYVDEKGNKAKHIQIRNELFGFYGNPELISELDKIVDPGYFEPYSRYVWDAYVFEK